MGFSARRHDNNKPFSSPGTVFTPHNMKRWKLKSGRREENNFLAKTLKFRRWNIEFHKCENVFKLLHNQMRSGRMLRWIFSRVDWVPSLSWSQVNSSRLSNCFTQNFLSKLYFNAIPNSPMHCIKFSLHSLDSPPAMCSSYIQHAINQFFLFIFQFFSSFYSGEKCFYIPKGKARLFPW